MKLNLLLTPTKTDCPRLSDDVQDPASLRWAYRLFWFTCVLFFASTVGGKLWDRTWHLTHVFDTFWSPPHFFVFVMTTISGLFIASIAFIPRLRQWYGPTVRVPIFPFPVPGPLVMLGAGLIALSCTIMFDNFWHSTFGLDETQWSAPHDTLTWCWFTIILGFVAARLAFHKYYPVDWITRIVMVFMLLVFLCPPFLGPFYLNYTPGLEMAQANMPIVRTEPTALHVYHIYLHYGITRLTSPLFVLQVSLFAGVATSFLRKFSPQKVVFFLAPCAWSGMLMARDLITIDFVHYHGVHTLTHILPVALHEPALWVPIPLLVALVSYELLSRTSLNETRIFLICGLLFSTCVLLIWHNAPWEFLLIVPAALATLYGSWIGKWIYGMLEKPTLRRLMCFLLCVCVLVPGVLGIFDLMLRWSVPM